MTRQTPSLPSTGPTPPTANPSLPIESLLGVADVARILSISRRGVERLRASGKLPRPDLVLGRMPRWKPSTILVLIDGGGHL
jgi:hypothetical protein